MTFCEDPIGGQRIIQNESQVPHTIQTESQKPVFTNAYGTLFNDLVRTARNDRARYLRWQWSHEGVVAIGLSELGLALVPMYRYPIGGVSLEFPRGAVEKGESATQGSIREMREEGGLLLTDVKPIGIVYPDTGLIQTAVTVCRGRATVADLTPPNAPEALESVGALRWLSEQELWGEIAAGHVRCSITIAAFALHMSRPT